MDFVSVFCKNCCLVLSSGMFSIHHDVAWGTVSVVSNFYTKQIYQPKIWIWSIGKSKQINARSNFRGKDCLPGTIFLGSNDSSANSLIRSPNDWIVRGLICWYHILFYFTSQRALTIWVAVKVSFSNIAVTVSSPIAALQLTHPNKQQTSF